MATGEEALMVLKWAQGSGEEEVDEGEFGDFNSETQQSKAERGGWQMALLGCTPTVVG